LLWKGKRRREQGGFLGADKILAELKGDVSSLRVGLMIDGSPARGTLNESKSFFHCISLSLSLSLSLTYTLFIAFTHNVGFHFCRGSHNSRSSD
jgi:hypothetical protein